MPPTTTWTSLQAELDMLKAASLQHPFDVMAAHIQKLIDSKPEMLGYTPAVVKALLEILRKMLTEVSAGKNVHQVFESARTPGFINHTVEGDNVIQNSGPAINNFIKIGAEEVKQELPPPDLEIPVVLLVMTQEEAAAFADGTVFKNLPKDFAKDFTDDFQQLHELLAAPRVNAWPGRYGPRPQDWQPFPKTPDTIEKIVMDMFAEVRRRNRYPRQVVPKFLNIRDVNADRDELRNLRRDGCMIIKDVISMRHPEIQKEYRQSLLDSFPNTIIVRISAAADVLTLPQPLFTNWVEHYKDLEFSKRLYNDKDKKCREVWRDVELNEILFNSVPELIPKEERAKSVMADRITGGGAK